MRERRLQINPEPLRVVAARPEPYRPGWRCFHEDGRGRCTSRETKRVVIDGDAEWLCPKHAGEE